MQLGEIASNLICISTVYWHHITGIKLLLVYVMPTGMEEAPKAALDIHCLWQGGRAALTSTIN